MAFNGPWGICVASNIAPTGLVRYSAAALKTVITTGVWPDGNMSEPPMGTSCGATMKTADLNALVAYLRSLPPK